MVSLFRTIRQKLLAQNRVTQYLAYAIGEIFLVMIGILLALQVNEWRDIRIQHRKEIKTIELLIRDLKADKEKMEFFKEKLIQQEKGVIQFLDWIQKETYPDSTLKYARIGLTIWNYRPTYPTYTGLLESGNLDLISDPETRDLVIEYHDETIPYLDDLRERYKQMGLKMDETFEPYLSYRNEDGEWKLIGTFQGRELQADILSQNILASAGNQRAWLIHRIEEIFIPSNQELGKALSLYLEDLKSN